MAGKTAFLCYALEDEFRLPAFIAALNAWGVMFQALSPARQPQGALLSETLQQIHSCDVYLRLCTGATRASPLVALADNAFRGHMTAGRRQKQKLVNLILDPAYQIDAQDKATLYIETANKTRALWLEQLAAPLGVATLKQRVSRRALLGMGVGATLTVLSGGAAATLLVQQQRQRELVGQTIPNVKNLSGQPKWDIPLDISGGPSGATTQLFAVNGTYYAAVNGISTIGIFALSLADKSAKLIPLTLPKNFLLQSMSISGSLIFIGYFDSNQQYHLAAFPVAGGAQRFAFDVLQPVNPPIVDSDRFYCLTIDPSNNTFIGGYSAYDGSTIWKHPIVLDTFGPTPTSGWLTVADGAVYASSFENTLTCYDAATGASRWSFLARGQMTAPTIDGGIVYAGARDGAIYALDAANGKQRWQAQAVEGIIAPPIIDNGVLVIGSLNGYLYAIDAKSGRLFWRSILGDVQTNTSVFEITTRPVIYRNIVAVTSSDLLFAFDFRTGSPRWRYEPVAQSSDTLSSPFIDSGLILVGAPNGTVYAVNP